MVGGDTVLWELVMIEYYRIKASKKLFVHYLIISNLEHFLKLPLAFDDIIEALKIEKKLKENKFTRLQGIKVLSPFQHD